MAAIPSKSFNIKLSSCQSGKLCPGLCRWSGWSWGKGQAQAASCGGLQHNLRLAGLPEGQWDGQPQGSVVSRAEAAHRFLVSSFPFHRKKHSFMDLNNYWATAVWHILFLARRKQLPCPHGAYLLVWKEETVNITINKMLRNESAMTFRLRLTLVHVLVSFPLSDKYILNTF